MDRLTELAQLLTAHASTDGTHLTAIPETGMFRATVAQPRTPLIYEAGVVFMVRGKKNCYVGEKSFEFVAGQYLALFLPMPIEVEMKEASPESPALMTAISIDLNKVAKLLLRLDGTFPVKNEIDNPSGIFLQDMDDELLDAVIRLWRTVNNPAERLVLSDSIIEEIYFRLLCRDQTGSLQKLLQQSGQIQQLAKPIRQIHTQLNQAVSVEELADLAGMSLSGFHKSFKDVMHVSPLQYAKLLKLTYSQSLLREGKTVAESSRMVGYNSATQFSREFKRHFGHSPSQTSSEN